MQVRTITAPDGSDPVRINGCTGRLELLLGQWSDQPGNEQIVLSSNRKELDPRFGQINLNLCLTDGRTVYLVKNLSRDGGPGAIKRLQQGAGGPEMAGERAMRKARLVSQLGNGTIVFDGQEWLVVAALPMPVPRRRADALFTEAMVQLFRYAALVEHLRRGAVALDEEDAPNTAAVSLPRRLSAAERRLVDLEAMAIVRAHLEDQGYAVKDVASRESYDFIASQGSDVLYVEVKGTTLDPWAVELTAAEHTVAQRQGGRYRLYVVQFEAFERLHKYRLVNVHNPVLNRNCTVIPVRYRVQGS